MATPASTASGNAGEVDMQPRPLRGRPRLTRRPRLLHRGRSALPDSSTEGRITRGSTRPSARTPSTPQRGPVARAFRQYGSEIVRDIFIALLAVGVTFTLDNRIATRQEQAEDRRAEQQEVLENIRFVRERSGDPASIKPFVAIQLNEANLSGLALGCETPGAENCATFLDASMREDTLVDTNLKNAGLSGANLSGANLFRTQLPDANLSSSILSGADLRFAILSGADLPGANLIDANLSS